ncbi:Fic family protein [Acetobacterium fimetarium]|uniref:Fic family protein n=1 Tax=Acetobacterium fimetarium TaxID=52691 RepID=A0ABR6WV83_9FIRM|nr:Fic family protein [Acetobacterium fimetarium]MBC3804119.1 Fic family protein [Acetobacterium fimetarium]
MYLEEYQAGTYERQTDYSAFIPSHINKQWEWRTPEINVLLEQANLELGRLGSYSELVPNIDLYIRMHLKVEANKSNRIEGTQTTIEEELMPIRDLDPEKRDDAREVQNYIRALQHGVDRIIRDDFPLSSRLIREIHNELMQGVRGEHKTPGEYRTSQNWIGGSMPSNASYVPPSHLHIPELITDMEKFIHNDEIYVPLLIRIAMIHYQFESIHPFLDGNGRAGRIMIPLFLLDSGLLKKPCFYISDYFEIHRTEYYDALNRVRLNQDMIGWIIFFLKASVATAKSARVKFGNAVMLVDEYNRLVPQISGSTENVQAIFDAFYDNPIQNANVLSESNSISKQTVSRILAAMHEKGILEEITGYSRNRVYTMRKYLDVFRI